MPLKNKSSNKGIPLWKANELLVAQIEKAISPNAVIKHNVKLPVIGSNTKCTRQCDVVITSGKAPRESITIVEVQKRKSKPDINTFHGWHKKMQQVGAQQLICVSALGFPTSIIEQVRDQIGPTVSLVTLKEDGNLRSPFTLIPCRFKGAPGFFAKAKMGSIRF